MELFLQPDQHLAVLGFRIQGKEKLLQEGVVCGQSFLEKAI
jgi:hypothetical protein